MIARCPACRGRGTVRVPRTLAEIALRVEARLLAGRSIDGISATTLQSCGPCGGTGFIKLISRHEYELRTQWLTPAQVVAMKVSGEIPPNSTPHAGSHPAVPEASR